MITPKNLMTDEDVARLLSMSPAAVRAERYAAKREGREPNLPPAVRIGSRIRYVPEVVGRWVAERMETRGRDLAAV